jgi:hypothetical protein
MAAAITVGSIAGRLSGRLFELAEQVRRLDPSLGHEAVCPPALRLLRCRARVCSLVGYAMVPTSLILIVLLIAFFPGTFSYLFAWPKRRLVNPYFPVVGGIGALMIFTIILAISDVQIIWVSWVLLATSTLMAVLSVVMLRKALAVARAHERREAARRARGV